MTKSILIYDLETATLKDKPDPKTDKVRIGGFYSYITDKYYFVTNMNDIKKLISKHKIIVGFNTLQYDNVVLYNNGMHEDIIINKYGDARNKYRIDVDLMQIIKQRCVAMKIKEGMLADLLMSFSLDFITKTLGLVNEDEGKIKDFDYNILKKETWTEEESYTIKQYLKRDIDLTKKLYEWIENYFESFKDFLTNSDVEKKVYLTSSIASFAYKAICKELGWKEEYDNKIEYDYGGGYVSYPAGEKFEGDIYCFDFNSLYPSIMHQCNLYSPQIGGWKGNEKFKVKGEYAIENGKVEKLLKKWYEDRIRYKQNNDSREYSIKIVINTIYGLLGNSSFKLLANETSASDCTSLGRQWVMLARKKFKENGYEVIYTDTDSVYIIDSFNDKSKMLSVKNAIIKEIKDNVPCPYEKFDMEIDEEISHMWFFKGNTTTKSDEYMDDDDFIYKPLGLMKKNYVYLTKDGKVKVKNLGVRKKSTSKLSREIFWKYLTEKIKQEKKVKFSKAYFINIIQELLNKNLNIAAIRYNVQDVDSYKNSSQLQCQIAEKYGKGIHYLIPNKKIGVGKKKLYCSEKEFKDNKLTINDIDLSNVWSELNYFIEEEKLVDLTTWAI